MRTDAAIAYWKRRFSVSSSLNLQVECGFNDRNGVQLSTVQPDSTACFKPLLNLLRYERRCQREVSLARDKNVAAMFHPLMVRLEAGDNSFVCFPYDRNLQRSGI